MLYVICMCSNIYILSMEVFYLYFGNIPINTIRLYKSKRTECILISATDNVERNPRNTVLGCKVILIIVSTGAHQQWKSRRGNIGNILFFLRGFKKILHIRCVRLTTRQHCFSIGRDKIRKRRYSHKMCQHWFRINGRFHSSRTL